MLAPLTPFSIEDAGRVVQKAAHFLRKELPGMFEVHGDRARPVTLSISAVAALEVHHALDQWDYSVKQHLGMERDRTKKSVTGTDLWIIDEVAVSLHRLVGGISEEARRQSAQPHQVQTDTNVLWNFHVECQALIHQLSDEWHQPPTPDQEPASLPRRRPKP